MTEPASSEEIPHWDVPLALRGVLIELLDYAEPARHRNPKSCNDGTNGSTRQGGPISA